jgi:hypothetical protein
LWRGVVTPQIRVAFDRRQVIATATTMEAVGKTWVLDTATKGTGASVVPLDRVQKRPADQSGDPLYVPPERAPKQQAEPAPRRPRAFRVVDVVTRQTLAEHADTRATLELLRQVRSIVDVHVSVHVPETDGWRLLSLAEQRALWDARDQAVAPTS